MPDNISASHFDALFSALVPRPADLLSTRLVIFLKKMFRQILTFCQSFCYVIQKGILARVKYFSLLTNYFAWHLKQLNNFLNAINLLHVLKLFCILLCLGYDIWVKFTKSFCYVGPPKVRWTSFLTTIYVTSFSIFHIWVTVSIGLK